MVSISFSMDAKMYMRVWRFMNDEEIETISEGVRILIKKGFAHDAIILMEDRKAHEQQQKIDKKKGKKL